MKKPEKKKNRSLKIGAVPGTLVHVGPERSGDVKIHTFDYSADKFEENREDTLQNVEKCLQVESVTWINVSGIHDADLMKRLGEKFKLHDLLLEDLMNTEHRPKLEEYEDYTFMLLKMLSIGKDGRIDTEQIGLVLGASFVLSFQEKVGDVFEPIRERIRKSSGRVRSFGPDYLAFILIDIIIDNYFHVIENLSDRLDVLEQEVLDNPQEKILIDLQQFKQELVIVRKAVYPLREMLNAILREECGNVNQESLKYFRDSYDHCIEVIDAMESFIDLSNSVRDLYISSVSNKMNQIMKVLTIMASIFIPLTFIAGIYGMNFNHIPEIHDIENGYFIVWGVMLAVTLLMVIFFKRKKWF